MREKAIYKLKIDPEFQALIHPLQRHEYLQLEENLLKDGCIDPIIVWDDTIIDGHNRYEICTRHNIPFHVLDRYFECREEAVAWICAHQLGRRNISEETRKYLIGTQYRASKIADRMKNARGTNQHSSFPKGKKNVSDALVKGPSGHVTAQSVADENHVSAGTVQKYARYANALETIGEKVPELLPKILTGRYKISHKIIMELAKQSPEQIRGMMKRVEQEPQKFVHYKTVREEMTPSSTSTQKKTASVLKAPTRSIKDMPEFDPDAEFTSLSLTIPSWISTMNRAWEAADQSQVSHSACMQLSAELSKMKEQIILILEQLKEK